ncbi:MAG: hypothetical protein ACP5EQ_06720, partial [Candidatus Cloacimonadia bacterium]
MDSLRIIIWKMFETILGGREKDENYEILRYWRKLLGNINIRLEEDCETARISRTGEFVRLEIGKRFADRLTTPEDWIWVIGHELSHFSLGHLNEIRQNKPINRKVWNYIYDVAIEARMYRRLPFGAPFEKEIRLKPLMKNASGKSSAVGAFLINPYVWKESNIKLKTFLRQRISDRNLCQRAIRLYQSIYPEAPTQEMDYDVMVNELLFWLDGVVPIWLPVIGDGETEGKPDWVKKIRRNSRGGYGTFHSDDEIKFVEYSIPQIASAIASMASFDPENRILKQSRVLVKTVMPFIGRREAALLGAGIYPVFFTPRMLRETPSCFRPQVYIDLSGSMRDHLHLIYGLISKLSNVVGEPVWCFAGDVVPISMKDLKRGVAPISGGTSMEGVLKHAEKGNFRRIIVLGDGHFAESPGQIAEMARKARVEINLVLFRCFGYYPLQSIYQTAKDTYAKKVWTV